MTVSSFLLRRLRNLECLLRSNGSGGHESFTEITRSSPRGRTPKGYVLFLARMHRMQIGRLSCTLILFLLSQTIGPLPSPPRNFHERYCVRMPETLACRGLFKSSPRCRSSLFFPGASAIGPRRGSRGHP